MRVIRNLNEIEGIKDTVVTTGSFDGVHLGHKVIINRLIQLADKINGQSTLITFHPHPRIVLYPESAGKDLKLINTQKEKIFLLEKTGLTNLIVINFTKEFAQTSSYDFVKHILLEKLNAKKIIVGFNHHFGHNREGDYSYLHNLCQEYQFDVEEISQQDIENECVSSTRIRKALQEGKIQRANAYLDHQYIIIGKLFQNDNDRYCIFEKCLSIDIEEQVKLIPPQGIYAGYVTQGSETYKCMIIINAKSENDVDIIPVEASGLKRNKEAMLSFHKTMFQTDELTSISMNSIRQIKNDIEELIY